MNKIRAALARIAKALKLDHVLLARAQRRYKANRRRAYIAHNQQLGAQRRADSLRAHGHAAAAARVDKEVRRRAHVAYRNHLRAEHYLGVVKRLQQRIHGLKTKREHFRAELKKKVGSGPRAELRHAIHTAAANCASGHQNNYYSMTGALPDLAKTLAGMPYGHRFDCSSFATGVYFVCDLPDPNGGNYTPGETMYTGSLGEHGKRVSEAQAKTGDLVLYGPAPHHHVEVVDDPHAKTTIGHGSPPIDAGVFDLFGDGDYEIRSYV
jgi:hypothetical protein